MDKSILKKIIFLIAINVFIFLALTSSNNVMLVEKYIAINKLMVIFVASEFVSILFIYIVNKRLNMHWEEKIFYIVMAIAILAFFILGYITHGESMRSLLLNDKNDALMDFFNSVQYGHSPYENKVIYPPLINAIYGFLGRYMDTGNGGFVTRISQTGSLVYGIYAIISYSLCARLLYRIKFGAVSNRICLLGLLVFSLPFLFLYDRANSVLWVLISLLIYLMFYSSSKFSEKLLAYNALGIAAGIKISPFIFGILVLKNRKKAEILWALSIGIFWFFAPFIFTDGNIFKLLENIRNTDNIKDVIVLNGVINNVGSGVFVNISSLLDAVGRYLSINLRACASALSCFVCLSGIFISVVSKKLPEWQLWGLLTGIVVLVPGFSAIYNLVLFTIPLILFLNSKPQKNKFNMCILMCFIGIFIPLINYPLEALNIFMTDWHPLTITTLVESISALLLVLLLIGNGLMKVCKEYNGRKWLAFCIGGIFFSTAMLGCYTARNKPIDSFYSVNLNAEASVSGFAKENGEYLGIDEQEATVYLRTEKILKNGLLLSFGCRDEIESSVDEEIAVFINNEYISGKKITGLGNQYIFIPASDLQKYGDEDGIKLTLVRQNINAEYVPVLYIGSAEENKSVSNDSLLQYAASGLKHGKSALEADNMFSFLTSMKNLKHGIILEYYTDTSYYLGGQVELYVNGNYIASDTVSKVGTNLSCIDFYMLSTELQEKYKNDAIVDVTVKIMPKDSSKKTVPQSLFINYIGSVPELSAWKNVDLSHGDGRVILSSEDIQDGIDLSMDMQKISDGDIEVDVLQGKDLVGSYKLYPNTKYQGIHIPADKLNSNNNLVDLTFKVRNNELVDSLVVSYLASGEVMEALNGDDEVYFGRGLHFDKQANLQYMGDEATFFILPPTDDSALHLEYYVQEYLLKNTGINIDLFVNGMKIYAGLPCNLGKNDFFVDIPRDIINKSNGCLQITVVSNRTYNLRKLHVSRFNKENRSIGFKYVGF